MKLRESFQNQLSKPPKRRRAPPSQEDCKSQNTAEVSVKVQEAEIEAAICPSSRPFPWHCEFIPVSASVQDGHDPEDSVKPSVLCSKCEPIRLWSQVNLANTRLIKPSEEEFHHYDSVAELKKSCKNGCHLCVLIWHALDQHMPLTTKDGATSWTHGFLAPQAHI